MGLPIHLWSDDTFAKMVNGLDAKIVMLDEITENRRSFSVARVLVDCFQWEPIKEWMSIRCEGTTFDVYVKEFGGEGLEEEALVRDEQNHDRAVGAKSPIDDCTNRDLEIVMDGGRMQSEANRGLISGKRLMNGRDVSGTSSGDPTNREVWDAENGLTNDMAQKEKKVAAIHEETCGLSEEDITEPTQSSCPFPPGFGPCSSGLHAHKTIGAVKCKMVDWRS
ncbi:hypothetical protein PIB30_052759 [Stylosanthes scabra]|uniref:DUF4283 domain-containing protein n=1 Tax=Stylosanthes scabra TaxID=79078 RepID=A0ABU6YH30_9FABA|nr:hypothetical protein [Stylosanthes scabra]